MRMKNKIVQSKNQPNAEQKQFREKLRSLYPGSEIHHPVGTTGKHNKIHIGHWWILALNPAQHKEIHTYGKDRKGVEKISFSIQMGRYKDEYHRMPVPDDVLEAIQNYHL